VLGGKHLAIPTGIKNGERATATATRMTARATSFVFTFPSASPLPRPGGERTHLGPPNKKPLSGGGKRLTTTVTTQAGTNVAAQCRFPTQALSKQVLRLPRLRWGSQSDHPSDTSLCTTQPPENQEIKVRPGRPGDLFDKAATPRRGRTMNKIGVVRPSAERRSRSGRRP